MKTIKSRIAQGAEDEPGFFCPCCEESFPEFRPFGLISRPNAQCPGCGSLERHRLLWLYLQQRTKICSAGLKLLHVAPERVLSLALSSLPNLAYLSGDLDQNKAMLQMDVTDIDFEDESFDVIICSHVLEHVREDRRAMRELARVLKTGGWAILQVPIDLSRTCTFEDPTIVSPQDRERFFGQHDHVRVYGPDYVERLSEAGFDVKVIPYARELGLKQIRRFSLMEAEDIYHCTKLEVETAVRRKERRKLDLVLSECKVPAVPAAGPNDKLSSKEWFEAVRSAKDDIAALISPGEKFILVDQAQLSAGGFVEGRRDIPFLEHDGQYCGPPPDDEVAIQEFERLRRAGASFIIFAWPAFWWLDHYAGFHRYLQANFHRVVRNERLIVFDLQKPLAQLESNTTP